MTPPRCPATRSDGTRCELTEGHAEASHRATVLRPSVVRWGSAEDFARLGVRDQEHFDLLREAGRRIAAVRELT